MADRRAQLQAQTAVRGQQGIASRLGSHRAVPHDEMGQHGEDGLASCTLNAPHGESAESHSGIMGVAGQRAAAVTGRFMVELKADGEDEGEDAGRGLLGSQRIDSFTLAFREFTGK